MTIYVEKKYLITRGGKGGPETRVAVPGNGPLLVATEPFFRWEDHYSCYGHDSSVLYVAVYEGDYAWLRRDTWVPAAGHPAQGRQEIILYQHEGIKSLVERGCYDFGKPDKAVALSSDRAALVSLRKRIARFAHEYGLCLVGDEKKNLSLEGFEALADTQEEGWDGLLNELHKQFTR